MTEHHYECGDGTILVVKYEYEGPTRGGQFQPPESDSVNVYGATVGIDIAGEQVEVEVWHKLTGIQREAIEEDIAKAEAEK